MKIKNNYIKENEIYRKRDWFLVLAILIFVLVSQSFMYQLTNYLTFKTTASPNLGGIVLHGLVLGLLLLLVAHLLFM